MSFSEPAELTGWRKAIVVGLFLLAILMLPVGFLFWALASCPAFGPTDCQPPSEIAQWLMFPGMAVILLIVALALRSYLKSKEPR